MRRDRRGRRIGRNPWRDYITDLWRCADHAWWLAMEDTTSLYATEVREYRAEHPRPTLREFMVQLGPVWSGHAGEMGAAA